MKVIETKLAGVVIVEPDVFGDSRGYFMETWSRKKYEERGLPGNFAQDNVSFSAQGVLRGLHLQYPNSQGKLVSVLQGEVYDVAVDVRPDSPTFRQWIAVTLSVENKRQFYIPEGYAHGFCVISETALFMYKCTDNYCPASEIGILWDDPDIGIDWPVKSPVLSSKDSVHSRLRDISPDRLPRLGG